MSAAKWEGNSEKWTAGRSYWGERMLGALCLTMANLTFGGMPFATTYLTFPNSTEAAAHSSCFSCPDLKSHKATPVSSPPWGIDIACGCQFVPEFGAAERLWAETMLKCLIPLGLMSAHTLRWKRHFLH